MNGLKQRIIGALVLVSLAVIFVPMMFDEPHSERQTTDIKIPEEPPFPEVEMPEPETTEPPEYRIEEIDSADSGAATTEAPEPPESVDGVDDSAVTAVSPEESASSQAEGSVNQAEGSSSDDSAQSPQQSEEEPAPTEFTRSLEGAWVVQLGSFGSNDNATRLRDKVRERGYNSHLQRISRGDSDLTRVFIGPFAEKAEAEKAKQALDKAFGLNSLVTTGGK